MAAASFGTLTSTVHDFGKTPSGEIVKRIRLSNEVMTADVLTYGANLLSVKVPSRHSGPQEMTLNASGDLEDVIERGASTYFGATAGRVANRIANGKFSLDGESYSLPCNNGPNHLHGGPGGFSTKVWDIVGEPSGGAVTLQLVSPDGDEGYPGKVTATAEYSLNEACMLRIEFKATTDAPTIVNLCNHTYWNLSGDLTSGKGIADHTLWLDCPKYVETDPETLIPTGKLNNAEGPMDFSDPEGTLLGPRLHEVMGGSEPGFDHCFCMTERDDDLALRMSRPVAKLHHPGTNRWMSVATTQPGVQLYTANFLPKDADVSSPFRQHNALCLETQHFPDSINQPAFPSTVLRPGEEYRQCTIHTFEWS